MFGQLPTGGVAGKGRPALLCDAEGRGVRTRSEEHTSELQSPIFPYTTLFRSWLGSQQGIFSVSKTNLDAFGRSERTPINCTAYGRYDGLPSLECSGSYQPAAWRGKDGQLYFATLKGVVSVQDRKSTRLNSSHRSFPTRRSSDLGSAHSRAFLA